MIPIDDPVYETSTTPSVVGAVTEMTPVPFTAVIPVVAPVYVSATTPLLVVAVIGGVPFTAMIPVAAVIELLDELTVPATTRFPPITTSPVAY